MACVTGMVGQIELDVAAAVFGASVKAFSGGTVWVLLPISRKSVHRSWEKTFSNRRTEGV